jgi:magnesium transporter
MMLRSSGVVWGPRTILGGIMASPLARLRRLMKTARSRSLAQGTAIPKLSIPSADTASGIAMEPGRCPRSDEPVRITCIDYSPQKVQIEEVADLADFLSRHRPSWSCVRWINVDGLKQTDVIHALAEKYHLHPLAVEDTLHPIQRPKAEDYPAAEELPGRLFVVARSIESSEDQLYTEQTSFFLGRATLLTFQEIPGDAFDPIRQRIQVAGSRLRENDASFLMYSLLDAIVDSYFPILERCSERLEELEEELLLRPTQETLHKVHAMKRELLLIRRAAWPMRELIMQLQRDAHEGISNTTRTYFRDVYDHGVQIIDLIETYREITASLTETYMSAVSNRMNEIMKVLTVIGTIFIPLTFLAGVYGMNMPIPENHWPGSYPVFWLVCASVAATMLYWFWRRGWL